jgi:hypothetical protein
VRKCEVLHLLHHDRASLFAGKQHAILQRPFIKGRDLLDSALRQTGWQGGELTGEYWRGILRQKQENVDWTAARADVRTVPGNGAGGEFAAVREPGKYLSTKVSKPVSRS